MSIAGKLKENRLRWNEHYERRNNDEVVRRGYRWMAVEDGVGQRKNCRMLLGKICENVELVGTWKEKIRVADSTGFTYPNLTLHK